jgi:hypothetical protein
MLQINTTHYLRSYPEFRRECSRIFGTDEYQCRNHTAQDHCGGTEALYEAQHQEAGIQYMQTRVWKYHFNGTVGTGLTLDEALSDHERKYDEAYRAVGR